MECSICGDEIDKQVHPVTGAVVWDKGHNAEPITDGRCCSECNAEIVVPARIDQLVDLGFLTVIEDDEDRVYH